ncbi:MAG: ferrochelatase, partial [Bryobacteraceae bacterium]
RYGAPTVERTLRELVTDGVERLLVLPLYPQYSGATTGSAFDAVASALAGLRWVPAFRFVNHYHDDPGYIAAVAASVRESWSHGGRTERLLFSFHGMPRATLTAGDPYHCQCHASARLVAQSLQLEDEEWTVAFQSRFGRTQWLGPASDETLSGWARSSVKTVTVVCPGFAVDCLETLEEVNLRYRKAFLAAGGERFDYVPALNDSPAHVRALSELIVREMTHWPEAGADYAPSIYAEEAAAQARQARKLGAPR